MREQMPTVGSKPPMVENLVRSLVYLAVGIGTEVLFHPVMPWTYVFGPLVLLFGLGVGTGLFDRPYRRWSLIPRIAIGIGASVFSLLQGASLLPLCIFLFAFYITRWVLSIDLPAR